MDWFLLIVLGLDLGVGVFYLWLLEGASNSQSGERILKELEIEQLLGSDAKSGQALVWKRRCGLRLSWGA